MLPRRPELNHAFSHPGHPQHVERLAFYRAQALGGPAAYTTGLGGETLVLGRLPHWSWNGLVES